MRLTPFGGEGPPAWGKLAALAAVAVGTCVLAGALIAAAHPDPAPLVTNLPEQNRGFYGGVLATIAVLAVVAREIPALLRFIKGKRNGHHRRDSDEFDATPQDQLRTHPGGQTIEEIRAQAKAEALEEAREQTKVTILQTRMDAAWTYLDDVKAWRLTLERELGQLPTSDEVMELGRKIDDLRDHTDKLGELARDLMDDHIRAFHLPKQ
jgi:cell division protein FtsB